MPQSPEIEHLQNAVLAARKVIKAETSKPTPPTPTEEAEVEAARARLEQASQSPEGTPYVR